MGFVAFNGCCKEQVDTAEHILYDCEAIALKRWQYFGRAIFKTAELSYIVSTVVVNLFLVYDLIEIRVCSQ